MFASRAAARLLAAPAPPHRCLASLASLRLRPTPPQPSSERKPFQQPNRRRDDALVPRMLPAVPATSSNLQAWVSSWESPRVGITELRADVWGLPPRQDLIHNVVLYQRTGRRQGTASSKGRSEVSGGGRKPRPQKGSGRSRQGSIRAPHMRGGGACFGPKPRDYSYKMNRKVRALALKVALSDKYRRNSLVVLDELGDAGGGKAKALVERLAGLGIRRGTHRVMIVGVTEEYDPLPHGAPARAPRLLAEQRLLYRASRNLDFVHVTSATRASVFDLVRAEVLVASLDGLRELEARLFNQAGGLHRAAFAPHALAASAVAKPYDVAELLAEAVPTALEQTA